MQNLTDKQLLDMCVNYIYTPQGLLISCIAFMILIGLIGLTIGLFRTIALIKTDCEEILKDK